MRFISQCLSKGTLELELYKLAPLPNCENTFFASRLTKKEPGILQGLPSSFIDKEVTPLVCNSKPLMFVLLKPMGYASATHPVP